MVVPEIMNLVGTEEVHTMVCTPVRWVVGSQVLGFIKVEMTVREGEME